MTSTNTHVGLGGETRPSSKVIKPPGGGSSDIFGPGQEEKCARRVKNHLASNLFLNDDPAPVSKPTSPRASPGNTSFNRLFGSSPPKTPSTKPLNSTRVIVTSPESPIGKNGIVQNGHKNGDTTDDGASTNGNASPTTNGNMTNGVTTNGTSTPVNGTATPVNGTPRIRNRVPPGGYSSGLW